MQTNRPDFRDAIEGPGLQRPARVAWTFGLQCHFRLYSRAAVIAMANAFTLTFSAGNYLASSSSVIPKLCRSF